MPIWGNRDKEQPAEEPSAGAEPAGPSAAETAPENRPTGGSTAAGAAAADAAPEGEPAAGEPAPAFRSAQGQQPAPEYAQAPGDERAPAGTPERGYERAPAEAAQQGYGQVPAEVPEPAGAPVPARTPAAAAEPAPTMNEAPTGTDAPAPVLTEEAAVIDEETVVKGPAAAMPAATSPVAAAPAARGGISPPRWSEIMATFVDDPRGSVKMAADAVDTVIEELVASIRARQQALASSWQASDADTERLRTALREYRKFGAQVQQISPAGPSGQETVTA